MSRPARDEAERFMEKVSIQNNGCHLWTAQVKRDGYGRFSFRGKTAQSAHRVSHILFKGEIPEGMCVLHKCDVRTCVNPEHLFLGTLVDNVKDMDEKGRRVPKNTALDRIQAEVVKALLSIGVSQQNIADRFSVNQTVISRIKLGKIQAFI